MYPAALTGTYAEAADQGSRLAAGALIPQRAPESRGSQRPAAALLPSGAALVAAYPLHPKTWMLW